MTASPLPPSLAERLLRATVRDAEWREAITGDLREEFAGAARTRGRSGAVRWYWRQALPLAVRFVVGRLVPAATPPRRRRVTIVDIERTSSLGSGWGRELRHAWRAITQRPAVSAVIIGTLAMALAANAVIFNLADALYLRPFRFPDVDRLVVIASDAPTESPFIDRESVAPADYLDWTRSASSAADLAAVEWWDPNFSGVDIPEQVPGVKVTPGFFELLGVQPALGRTFTAEDAQPEAHRQVVLSHAFWVRQFAHDPGVLGKTVRLDGESYEVVGVAPPRFQIPFGANVWAPLAYDEAGWAERTRGDLMVLGRLTPGHTVSSAGAEFANLVARLSAEHPDTNRGRLVSVRTLSRGLGDDGVGPFLAISQAAATLLLLVACANIANLLLARGTVRQAEFAVRLALGAGRARLVLQLLIEGLCLAVLAVGAGAGLAVVAMQLVRGVLPASVIRFVPGYAYLAMDLSAFTVTAALGAAATVLFALLPALQSSRATLAQGALASTRSSTPPAARQWVRSTLAGAQVALSLAVIVVAALLASAVDRATDSTVGFDRRQLVTAQLTLPERPYAEAERRRQFVDAALAHVAARPGIMAVAAASTLPFSGVSSSRPFMPDGAEIDESEARSVNLVRVSEGYFSAMRIPVAGGRTFTTTDREGSLGVAAISRSLADRFFPGGDAIGRRFRLGKSAPWITVVGIVGDVVSEVFVGRWAPTVYLPLTQDPTLALTLVARTSRADDETAAAMRRAVTTVDPDQPVLHLLTMEELMAVRMAGLDFFSRTLLVMSGLALVLALTGMYSLMAYLAAQRTREMGVRVALGATRAQVTWLATSRAARITAMGVLVGLGLSVGLSRAMQAAFFGLVTPDATIVMAATMLLALGALAAGYLPARKAAAQDPWVALRTE